MSLSASCSPKIATVFLKFSATFDDLMLVDLLQNRITEETLAKLQDLAKETDLAGAIKSMFSGEKINRTEDRAVLHVALRNRSNTPIVVDGKDVMPEVNAVLEKMKTFSEAIISGSWKGYTGKPITDVVNIGIGGSDLGPFMVTSAASGIKITSTCTLFQRRWHPHCRSAEKRQPETTLFPGRVQKTFTTCETMTNAHSARDWFSATAGDDKHVAKTCGALHQRESGWRVRHRHRQHVRNSGTGLAGRYSCGRRLACPSFSGWASTTSSSCCPARTRWINTSPPHPGGRKTCWYCWRFIGIWYNNFFGAETEAIPAVRPVHAPFAAYFSRATWSPMVSMLTVMATPWTTRRVRSSGASRAPTVSTRVLPADPSGHQNGTVRFHRPGYHPQPALRSSSGAAVQLLSPDRGPAFGKSREVVGRNIAIRVKIRRPEHVGAVPKRSKATARLTHPAA